MFDASMPNPAQRGGRGFRRLALAMLHAALGLCALEILAACGPAATVSTVAPASTARAQTASAAPATLPAGAIEEGLASWYGPGFAGRLTANGEVFDPNELTAAHKTLPFDTRLRVTNLRNGRTVVVRINDRGPFKPGRIIDLSRAAAEAIGMIGSGVVRVAITPVGGEAGALRASTYPSLNTYEVITPDHPIGTLLVLSGLERADRIVVRVVANEPTANGEATILVSTELIGILGAAVIVETE